MTSFPAQRLRAADRGLLRDGFKADVVVFDAKTVKAPATRTEPKQFPIGIDHVIVNGQVVIDGGWHTGVLAGRALHQRPGLDVGCGQWRLAQDGRMTALPVVCVSKSL